MKKIDKNKIAKNIVHNQKIRREITKKSFLWFLKIFLSNYLDYDLAPFQEEMIYIAEQDRYQILSVMAFRNSGKSTILNLGFVLWSVLGIPQKKCVVIISKTQSQAKNHFLNIRYQLENNRLLISDMGPFKSDENPLGMHSLELPQLGAKIFSISVEQSIRGIRHNNNRLDLIICDDVEDIRSVETEHRRDNVYDWFMSEVVPAGDEKTKIIILGNLLHEQSFLMKLKDYSTEHPETSIFRAYPIIDEEDKTLWPQKFDMDKINKISESMPEEIWEREYLLKILPKYVVYLPEKKDSQSHGPEPYRQAPIIKEMEKYQINAPYIGSCVILY